MYLWVKNYDYMKIGFVNLTIAVVGMAAFMLCVHGCRAKDAAAPVTDDEMALIERAEGTMRVLTVANEDDKEVLRSECGDLPLEFVGSEQFRKLAALMIDTMTSPEQDGVGIAGPQVGLKRRIVAVQRFDKEGEPVEIYPNIHVVSYNGEPLPGPEGCLSVPGCRGMVLRYPEIVISYIDPTSLEPENETVKGFTAVIFQHETDHLEGILYTDKASSVEKF